MRLAVWLWLHDSESQNQAPFKMDVQMETQRGLFPPVDSWAKHCSENNKKTSALIIVGEGLKSTALWHAEKREAAVYGVC